MLLYLLLCVLIIMANCDSQWFRCGNSTLQSDWIPRNQFCDGVRHCADGSDESLRNCKLHYKATEQASEYAFCASGARILSDKVCNDITDCMDESDEMGCKGEINLYNYRGNCSESMVQCKRERKCIEIKKLCDNKYDCNDGWDESLPICFADCKSGQFQCGNGACIEGSLVCDNKPDCLDGADELPNVCVDIPNYIPMPSINCTLSKYKRVFIREDTIPHLKGGEKYFLPHEIVHLGCPTYKRPSGSVWNVCNINGQWQFPLLECQRRKRE